MELAGVELAFLVLAVLVGAAVRGFTGFGASLIWVSSLTLVVDPDQAIPVVVMMEVVSSTVLFSRSRGEIAWPAVGRLVAGAMAGLPVGIAVLLVLSADVMQTVISVVVVVSALVLASGRRLHRDPSGSATIATGVVSGVMNGVTGAGGPPVIVLFLGSPKGMAVGRASMSMYFGLTDLIAVGLLAGAGLVDSVALWRLVALVPSVVIGARVGERGFAAVSPERVRLVAVGVLVVLALAGLVR